MSELAKMSGDVIKHTLPEKATAGQLADDLIARFPFTMPVYFYVPDGNGNKREQRAASDWLNALQHAGVMLNERMEMKEGK